MLKNHLRAWAIFLATLTMLLIAYDARAALTIPLTVNLSETVTVTGTPRITVDVGGTTRYATYTSGSGSSTLTFTLSPQAGDVDLDGITVSSPIDLNGGSIKDTAGNDATLTFTPPNTAGIKINYPSLSMDFVTDADGRYTLNGTAYNDLTSFLSASGGTFSRASVGTYYDSTGVLQTASSGTPRFDWDPVTHAAKGILIEESRTNLIKHGDDFTVSPWANAVGGTSTRVNSNVSFYAYAGVITATSSGGGLRQAIGGLSAQKYVWSFYIESANSTALVFRLENGGAAYGTYCGVTFNPSTGTFSSSLGYINASAKPMGSGWFVKLELPTASGGLQANLEILANNGDIFKYATPQLEQGSFATSYIPTTSAAVTRSADILSVPTAGAWFNAASGAIFSESSFLNFTSTTAMDTAYALWGSGNTRMVTGRRIGGSASASELAFYVQDSGVDQAWLRSSSAVLGSSPVKFSSAYAANSFAHQTASLSLATDTLGSVPLVTSFFIGSQNGISSFLNGNIRSLKYYPARVTDAQLQLLTQ